MNETLVKPNEFQRNQMLNGKVAIVTGASRGIGRAVAERLAQDGAAVVINYASSEAEARDVETTITSRGGQAAIFQADISRSADVRSLFRSCIDRFGRVDIL